MVVIAIIAILASLLLPALAKAKSAALGTECRVRHPTPPAPVGTTITAPSGNVGAAVKFGTRRRSDRSTPERQVITSVTLLPRVDASLPAALLQNTPTITATNRNVQLPLTGTSRFFRLRKP